MGSKLETLRKERKTERGVSWNPEFPGTVPVAFVPYSPHLRLLFSTIQGAELIPMSKYCCIGMKANCSVRGERGFGILEEDGLVFLEARFADEEDEPKVNVQEYPVVLRVRTQLLYCPWCGTKVESLLSD